MLAEPDVEHTGASHNATGSGPVVGSTRDSGSARIPGEWRDPSVDAMTNTASSRHFPFTTRVLLPVALAVSTVTLAGPAQAVPDPGTPTLSTSPPTQPGAGPTAADAQQAAADIALLRANLTRLHGGDYSATIWFDETSGITVQRGRFAGRTLEFG